MSATINTDQMAILNSLISNDDRVAYYVKLHEYTGSRAALLMAQISSSSGYIGGAAWGINNAYELVLPGYPSGGVSAFSRDIAEAERLAIQTAQIAPGVFSVPDDQQMLIGAAEVWRKKGLEAYFPGNILIGLNYLRDGDSRAVK